MFNFFSRKPKPQPTAPVPDDQHRSASLLDSLDPLTPAEFSALQLPDPNNAGGPVAITLTLEGGKLVSIMREPATGGCGFAWRIHNTVEGKSETSMVLQQRPDTIEEQILKEIVASEACAARARVAAEVTGRAYYKVVAQAYFMDRHHESGEVVERVVARPVMLVRADSNDEAWQFMRSVHAKDDSASYLKLRLHRVGKIDPRDVQNEINSIRENNPAGFRAFEGGEINTNEEDDA